MGQAAVADRDADPEREVRLEDAPAKPASLEVDAIALSEVPDGDIAPIHRQYLVVFRDLNLVAGTRAQTDDGLAPRREDPGHEVGLTIGPDDPSRPAHQGVDPLPAVGGRDERVAGHARIRGVDAPVLGAGVPLVDGGVVLHTGVRAGPGRVGDLVPEFLGGHAPGHLLVGAAAQLPLAPALEHVEEAIGHADAVIGVLAGDGEIGVAVPVRVVLGEDELGDALGRELHRPLDIPLGHHGRAGLAERRPEGRVPLGIGVDVRRVELVGPARRHHRLEPALPEARARHQGGDLLLLDDLPADELHHVGMVQIEADHLGGPPGGAARLDGAGRPVPDLEEGHQPG